MLLIENNLIYFLTIVAIPLLGLLINFLFFKKNFQLGSRIASLGIWVGFIDAVIAWFTGVPFSEKSASWGFLANELSWLMATLILFVSGIVHHFSLRYMAGDRNYRRYFLFLGTVTISTLLMVASDNILLFSAFWALSNLTLVFLMMHKVEWTAARYSGMLAMKSFALGLVCLTAGMGLLAYKCDTLSLRLIGENCENLSAAIRGRALFCIILAAFSQSGCWPFQGWLISSLNSPTPVSAFMHAGLVNGGGLLLARFAPIFFNESLLLHILFVLAVVTLVLGGIWKLLQSDVKRMLACSTMTQMGFMMMQCGLGLFSSALAHLCWHGLFKAFLFLRSGSTIAEKRRSNEERGSAVSTFFLSFLCGVMGAIGFVAGSGISLTHLDTNAVLIFFCWVASTQLANTLLQKRCSLFLVLAASVVCLVSGVIYGLTVDLIEVAVAPLQISQPQPLNYLHICATTLIFFTWIAFNLKLFNNHEGSLWWRRFYMSMLNASQPDPRTVTSTRNGYKF